MLITKTPFSKALTTKALIAASLMLSSAAYADFNHSTWDSLLNKNVTMTNGGKASVVNYNGMKADQSKLDGYLAATAKSTYWVKSVRLMISSTT
jgi:hypothetical protein